MRQLELIAGRGKEDLRAQYLADLARIEMLTRAPGKPMLRKADWAGEPCPAGQHAEDEGESWIEMERRTR